MTSQINCSIFRNCSWIEKEEGHLLTNDAGDATWVLTSAFIIFTMQSGFGLLEAGSCSVKSETNVMVKNAVDIIFGTIGYYIFGYALSYGNYGGYANGFTGVGILMTNTDTRDQEQLYAHYFFQLAFATTATTIVSGAMAERTNLKAYMMLSLVNFLSYVFPAHWVWSKNGFLAQLEVVDIAGCGPVHIVGGAAALVATMKLKPRTGAFGDQNRRIPMASPTNVVLGTFMLWWGWLGFNCGSTFGVSGGKWRLASKTAVNTMHGSIGGGFCSIIYCYFVTKKYQGKLDIGMFTSGILVGLVSITGVCAICKPWEAFIIGMIGGIFCAAGSRLMLFLKIDDPVCCVPVHLFGGTWGLIAVGLFADKEPVGNFSKNNGLFKGGNIRLLGVQILAIITIGAWALATSIIQLYCTDKLLGLRLSVGDEMLGPDRVEHGIMKSAYLLDYSSRSSVNANDVANFDHMTNRTLATITNKTFIATDNGIHLSDILPREVKMSRSQENLSSFT